jgi:hypothetical protein
VKPTQYTGSTSDAHNAISIGIDGKGYLHVAWDHHNVPLRYARSREPMSIELTDKLPMTGQRESRVSYPEFYPLPDGGLICLYRDGASGSGNLAMNRYDAATSTWSAVHGNLINGEGQRNAYTQATVDQQGVIHLSWVWRESPDVATNHDLCYARSTDGGKTWTRSDGTVYTVPITAATAEVAVQIPQRSELINQTSMTTDSKGRPYIATYWREQGQEIPQYHVVYRDTDGWKTSVVGGQTIAFRLGGAGTKRIPISRPQILADATGATDKAYLLFRDEGRGNKASIAICDDLSKPTWKIKDLTTTSVGQWEPTYDAALWAAKKELNVLVQKVDQRDAEGVSNVPPEMVYVLEWRNVPRASSP